MEPSEEISLKLLLGSKDYPSEENYVAQTQLPLENSKEGKVHLSDSIVYHTVNI